METKQTKVVLRRRSLLWLLIPAFIAPFIGFWLYGEWWMFFCVLLVGVIQMFPWAFLSFTDTDNTKIISVEEIDKYAKSEVRLDAILRVCFVILGLLNIFPFLASNSSFMQSTKGYFVVPYEGGLLVTLMTILLIAAWFISAFVMPKPDILKNKELYDSSKKTMEDLKEEKEQKNQLRIEEEKRRNALKYGEKAISLGCGVWVNEEDRKIFIKSDAFNFIDILDFSVSDNAVTIHSGSTSVAKTDTGSMVGRAIVGGAIMGGAGAVIGGATAKQNVVHSSSHSSVRHDYSIIVTVNSISSPNKTIKIGEDETTLNKIVSTLTVILHQNQKI